MGSALAVLVNQHIFARNTIRAMLFMPYISNMVAIAVGWSIISTRLTASSTFPAHSGFTTRPCVS